MGSSTTNAAGDPCSPAPKRQPPCSAGTSTSSMSHTPTKVVSSVLSTSLRSVHCGQHLLPLDIRSRPSLSLCDPPFFLSTIDTFHCTSSLLSYRPGTIRYFLTICFYPSLFELRCKPVSSAIPCELWTEQKLICFSATLATVLYSTVTVLYANGQLGFAKIRGKWRQRVHAVERSWTYNDAPPCAPTPRGTVKSPKGFRAKTPHRYTLSLFVRHTNRKCLAEQRDGERSTIDRNSSLSDGITVRWNVKARQLICLLFGRYQLGFGRKIKKGTVQQVCRS